MGKYFEDPDASSKKPMREDADLGLDGVKRWFYGGTPPADADEGESDHSSALSASALDRRLAATTASRTIGRA
jgi:hypothetical protein